MSVISRGVRQGDTLPPRLFNAVLRRAMDTIDLRECGISIDGEKLTHVQYADDVALVARSRPEMILMLDKLTEASTRVGIEVNARKTCPAALQPDNLSFSETSNMTSLNQLPISEPISLSPSNENGEAYDRDNIDG